MGKVQFTRGKIVTFAQALTLGKDIWLSPTVAGEATDVCPTTPTQVQLYLGDALTTTTGEWNPGKPILLV
jgi:hypothetical protein